MKKRPAGLQGKPKREVTTPLWQRWTLYLAASALMGLACAAATQWVVLRTGDLVLNWVLGHKAAFALTALLYAAAVCTLGLLLGRLWVSAAVVGAAATLLALTDYFKFSINGTPLSLEDFGLATQLGHVANVAGDLSPTSDFWLCLGGIAVCAAALAFAQPWLQIQGRSRLIGLAATFALTALLLLQPTAEAVGRAFGLDMETRLEMTENHDAHGLLLSLWREKNLHRKDPPRGYGEAYMRQVVQRVDELLADRPAAAAAEPNVIIVLSESFFDLNRLPDLTYERDPLENFHALQKESVSGSFYSHYLGYGTGYMEMSMLSGMRAGDLEPGVNICFMDSEVYARLDSLLRQFTNTGRYTAEMLHGFDNSLYNRVVTYPVLGCSELLFSPDVQNLGFDWEGGIYGGYYLKDAYLFQGMLHEMEKINEQGRRAVLYAITMENHQPFDPGKFYYECQIDMTSRTLNEEEMAVARVMLEGITRADQALGALTDALRDVETPTVVAFFGDHRPNIYMPDGETIYTKLGLCPANETTEWTTQQAADLYSTDYLIWANDAALLGERAGTRQPSSITALGPQLLELLDWPVSRYWGLLEKANQACIADTELYFVSGGGIPSARRSEAELSPEEQELLELREAVLYDMLYGKQYVTAAMNAPPGTPLD